MNAKVKITYSCSECIKKHSDNWCPTESIGDIGSLSFQSPPGKKKKAQVKLLKKCVSKFYISPLLHSVLLLQSFFPLGGSNTITSLCAPALVGSACVRAVRERVCAQGVYECQEEGAVGAHTASQSGSWDRKLCCCPNQRLKAPIATHEY